MWRDFLLQQRLELREPATEEQLATAERELGVKWPKELRALLLESNGVFDEYGSPCVRPAMDIVHATREMWALDDERHYMLFAPHIYFGQEANGDEYFFRVLGGEADTDIFRWSHEDDARVNYAHDMGVYVTNRVEEMRQKFDPDFDNATLDAFFDTLAFLALSGDGVVDPDAAARQLECVAATLKAAPDEQRRAFAGRAQGLASKEQSEERAAFFRGVSKNFGLFPDAP